MKGRVSLFPDRFDGGEPDLWTAAWYREDDVKTWSYDASGATVELALAGLVEVLGEALREAERKESIYAREAARP